MTQQPATSPIAFEIDIRRLPSKGLPVTIEANEKQRSELTEIHGLKQMERFVATLVVQDWKRDGVRVSGRVEADIVQACIATLDPVPAVIDEEIDALFVPEGSKLATPRLDADGEMILSADGPDAPEIFTGDTIDVGALAEEFFAMALDPYPRASGASERLTFTTSTDMPDSTSPFASLKRLTGKT